MFSKSLFKQSFKANWKIWSVVTIVLSLLVAQFCAMEEGVMDLTTVVFYGMLSIMVPVLYVVITANNLVAKQVDDDSLAYVLSTQTKRSQIVITQALFLVGSLFVTFASVTLTHILVKMVMRADSLTIKRIFCLNIASFWIAAAMSGICFMFSCVFNRAKNSIGVSGIIAVFFILMAMMSLFGGLSSAMSALENFKYMTITSLCDNASIMAGTHAWIWKGAILVVITCVTYTAGSIYFCKKDLPL